MNITQERALELAEKLPNFFDNFRASEKEEVSAILRRYAEIMQAEPVAEIERYENGMVVASPHKDAPHMLAEGVYQLIIKPAPCINK